MAGRRLLEDDIDTPWTEDWSGLTTTPATTPTATSATGRTGLVAPGDTYSPGGDESAGTTPGAGTGTTGATTTAHPYGWDQIATAYQEYLGRTGTDEEYLSHLGNPTLAGVNYSLNNIKTSREAGGYSAYQGYQSQVSALESETDPVKRAAARDALSRNLYNTLRSQGHDVKWQGDQLIVDGRAYDVAGGDPDVADTGATSTTTSGVTPSSAALAGWDQGKWNDPAHKTIKYVAGRIFSAYQPSDWLNPTKRAEIVAQLQAAGLNPTVIGDDQIDFNDGYGPVDVVQGAGLGGQAWQWGLVSEANTGAAGSSSLMPSWLSSLLAGGGTSTAGAGATGTTGATGAAGVSTGGWSGVSAGSKYTPGDIGTGDIPNYTLEQLLELAGSYEPGTLTNETWDTSGLTGLGAGAADPATEALILSILQNPESLDTATIEKMKAASKGELAEMGKQTDEDLAAFGARYGIEASPWLGAERARASRDTDLALAGANRDIEIEAAKQSLADRMAAAQLGQGWSESTNARNLANRGQQFGELSAQKAYQREGEVTQEGWRQQAAELKQAGVFQAFDKVMAQAAETGDRMALREQVNQKAAELGLDADKLMADYVISLMQDATDRYGIDVGAQVDREQLAQAGREFMEDLAFKYASLAQSAEQFGYTYGLNASELGLQADQFAWQQYMDSLGL